jgi:lysozyme family protein
MNYSFDQYFRWLLPWEGTVYENVPGDPGGPTKYGIDQRSHPTVNIRALTKDKAKEIYRTDYWRAIAGDQLQTRTAWAVMDSAVNCGTKQAVRWLQRALNVEDDGRLGPVTLAAAAASPDGPVAMSVLRQRGDHYLALGKRPQFRKFLKGWMNRNESLRKVLT